VCDVVWCVTDGETEDEDDVLDDDDDDEETTGARPRRISELKIPNKVKPIPLASSLFVFSPTNRSVVRRQRPRPVRERLAKQTFSA